MNRVLKRWILRIPLNPDRFFERPGFFIFWVLYRRKRMVWLKTFQAMESLMDRGRLR